MAREFAVRLSFYFAAIFVNLGLYLPFLPIWLAWRGMSPYEIGIITAVPLFIRIFATPAIGYWADARAGRRKTIIFGGWLGLACAGLLAAADTFWLILVLVAGFQLATQSIIPLAETKALAGARHYQIDYGRMRLWGSAAFIAANVIGGLVIARFGGGSVVYMVIAAVLATALAAHALPDDHLAQENHADAGESDPELAVALTPVWTILAQPWFVLLVLAGGCIQASHAVFYAFSALHWRSLGITDTWIGILWALGVVAEIALFAVSARALAWLGAAGLIVLGGVAAVVRWSIMACDPAFWMLFPLQCLHAFTFGATHLGALNLIQTYVPQGRTSTAQSAHSALAMGLIMGTVTFCAGLVFEPLGRLSFLVMAALAAAGLLVAIILAALPAARRRHWHPHRTDS
jgi:PPP family 3-phenylpropionic acid transporter